MNERPVAADFAALVREHQSMVFSLAWHILHDRGLAEDVAQEAFLQLHRNRKALASPGHAANWLRKVAVHRAIDVARRRRLRPQVSLEDAPEPHVGASAEDPGLTRKLRELVASLPERARAVVVLRFQEELRPEEIAELMGMPVGTVKSQLQRALGMLRTKLERTLGEKAV